MKAPPKIIMKMHIRTKAAATWWKIMDVTMAKLSTDMVANENIKIGFFPIIFWR